VARTARSAAAMVACLAFFAACSGDGRKSSGPSRVLATSTPAAAATTAPLAHGRSTGCRRTPATPPGVTDRTVTSGGKTRRYQLIVPDDYDGTKPLPVVFGLHALTVSYLFVPSMVGFADMERRYDFVGVAPSGLLNGSTPYWLAAPARHNYDLVFISELLDHLEAELCIDTGRVFSTGMSNGAQMSSLLACRLADRITAVAPVAGVEFSDSCRGRAVPVIAFHGTEDPIVPYAGGGLDAAAIADLSYWHGHVPAGLPEHHGVDAAMRAWANHNGCDRQPIDLRIAKEVRRRTWQHCRAATILYIVDGGGHAWPGKPVPGFEKVFGHVTTDIDASALIFDFFLTDEP
jgi:polyhydroxybutyrate depolymerase